MKTDVSTEAVSSGESTRSALTFTCNLSRKAFGAAFHFGDDAGRDLRKLLAEGAPDPGLKISGGVFQLKPPERAVLGLQLRRRADEVQRSDFVAGSHVFSHRRSGADCIFCIFNLQ